MGHHREVVHETASTGFARETDRFHRARPPYHQDIVRRTVNRFRAKTLVELGAGTGIFTRQLIDLGQPVVAIEPVYSMRDTLSKTVPEADIRVGSAEQIPLDSDTVDCVVAAQSFHWFNYRQALDEIHRVLRIGGHLVTIWNVADESVPWVNELENLVDRYRNGHPRYRDMAWRRAINSDSRYGAIDELRVENMVPTSPDGVVELVLSIGVISSLSQEKQDQIIQEVHRIVSAEGDSFLFPYQCQLQAWRALPIGG